MPHLPSGAAVVRRRLRHALGHNDVANQNRNTAFAPLFLLLRCKTCVCAAIGPIGLCDHRLRTLQLAAACRAISRLFSCLQTVAELCVAAKVQRSDFTRCVQQFRFVAPGVVRAVNHAACLQSLRCNQRLARTLVARPLVLQRCLQPRCR